MNTTEIKRDFSGQYNSTNKFVFLNNLEKEAEELFGKDWEAEDDVAQIDSLIKHVNGENELYRIYVDEYRDEDDIIVELSEDKVMIKKLINRLNACHRAMDSATDSLKELSLDDTDAFLELTGELAETEVLLIEINGNHNKK